jgi:iron complex outermembrane receptor protein
MVVKKFAGILVLFSAFLFVSYRFCFPQAMPMPAEGIAKRELLMFEEIPMVTSASKHPESIIRAPAAISVITSEDIENMDYENLWDFFRRVPGVDVETIDGRRGSVAPRGFTEVFTRRNQLLIDGRSAYTPLFGGTEWDYLPIFPEDIERIEVIRGPNATLYGSNAFTGVINIVSKDPKDTKGLMVKDGFGSHGYERGLLRYGGSAGKLDYRLGYTFHQDNGYGSNMGKDVNDSEKDHTISWRSKYNIDDNSNLELFLGDKEDHGRPVNVTATSATNDGHIRSNFQMLRYNTKVFEDQDFYIQLFRNELIENKNGPWYQADVNDEEVRQYDFEAQHTFKWLKDKMNTVWGLGFRYNQGGIYLFDTDSSGRTRKYGGDPLVDRIYRLFFNNDYKITDKWTFVFGAMFENNGFTGGSCSPRTSLLFAPKENHVFRATFARAYRTPTMLEDTQNNTFLKYGLGSSLTTLGNHALKNEVVDAYELGYNTWLMDNRLKLGGQGYINQYKNLLDVFGSSTTVGPSTTTVYSFDNSNSARAKGLELEAEFSPKNWVKLYTNLTVEKINDRGLDFQNSEPSFKVNFGTRLKSEKLGITANFDGYYVDTYNSKDIEDVTNTILKVRPYLRFDFRIAKTFFKGNLEWAIKGENLFDQSHVEARTGTSAPFTDVYIERAIYTTLTAKF